MTTKTDTAAFVNHYFEATQTNSVEAWVACFASDAKVEDPVGSPPVIGTDAIRSKGNELFKTFDRIGLYPEYVSTDGLRAAAKWNGRGVMKDGRSVKFEGIDFFEFDESGKIKNMLGFWNPADMIEVQ